MSLQLFGILNYTPDSFYDGGRRFSTTAALGAAQKLIDNGAHFIDIGAEATNPFVKPITAEDEITRLAVILPALLKQFPDLISLDTYHPETLAWALQFGKPILNDVSGLHNPAMMQLVKDNNLICIIGHLPSQAEGIPIRAHKFKLANFEQIVEELLARAQEAEAAGIDRTKIILDPNIGFGKSMRLNWQLLEFAKAVPNYKVMIGHSNKRFLGCDLTTGELLKNGQEIRYTAQRNLEAAEIAIKSGTAFLRVHEPVLYNQTVS